MKIWLISALVLMLCALTTICITQYMENNASKQDYVLWDTIAKIVFGIWVAGTLIPWFFLRNADIRQKPVKALEFACNFKEYSEFHDKLICNLAMHGYDEHKDIMSSSGFTVELKWRTSWGRLNAFALVKADEINETLQNEFYEILHGIIEDEANGYLRKEIYLIELYCVNRFSQYFSNIVNQNIYQGINLFHLPTGLLLENNTFYVARQKGGIMIAKYCRLYGLLRTLLKDIIAI